MTKPNTSPLQPSNRETGPACRNCRFWQAQPGAGGLVGIITDDTQGICRRRPPVVHLIPTRDGVSAMVPWPSTVAADWCGEFTLPGPTLRAAINLDGAKIAVDPAVAFPHGEHDAPLRNGDDD